jgi:hypothetical protein
VRKKVEASIKEVEARAALAKREAQEGAEAGGEECYLVGFCP